MAITSSPFGKLPDGRSVELYTLTNANGLRATIMNYGGIIVTLETPDRDGKLADIVLGKPDLDGYLAGHPYFGAITGRVAGRISGARFLLDGERFRLDRNNGDNSLHGGNDGFDKQLWDASVIQDGGEDVLSLHYVEPDGKNGFPGNLDCTVKYRLTDNNELRIDYDLKTDKATPQTVTNHSYFNLKGQGKGNILEHTVQIVADKYAAAEEDMTLTGEIESVRGEANDFREPAVLGDRIEGIHQQHGDNYFLNGGRTDEPRLVARVTEPTTGRIMECLTTEPCVQFYTSAQMEEREPGKQCSYGLHSALCLETQACPDAANRPSLGDIILRPGEAFTSTTIYQFSAE